MALIGRWPYADGYYYMDPWEPTALHIKKDTPKDIAEKLRKDVEAYIPESRSIFEDPETFLARGISSKDFHVMRVVQD